MPGLWQDVRYGARMLAKNPAFSAMVLLTLALGMGANTAIFSLLNSLFLRRPPVRDPSQLVNVYATRNERSYCPLSCRLPGLPRAKSGVLGPKPVPGAVAHTPEAAVLLVLQEYLPTADPKLDLMQGSNLDIYVARRAFKDVPFADRPKAIPGVRKAWCDVVGTTSCLRCVSATSGVVR